MPRLFTLRKFHEAYPHMHNSLQTLKLEVSKRDENGLMESGAVIEKRMTSNKRSALLIDEEAYFKWIKA